MRAGSFARDRRSRLAQCGRDGNGCRFELGIPAEKLRLQAPCIPRGLRPSTIDTMLGELPQARRHALAIGNVGQGVKHPKHVPSRRFYQRLRQIAIPFSSSKTEVSSALTQIHGSTRQSPRSTRMSARPVELDPRDLQATLLVLAEVLLRKPVRTTSQGVRPCACAFNRSAPLRIRFSHGQSCRAG